MSDVSFGENAPWFICISCMGPKIAKLPAYSESDLNFPPLPKNKLLKLSEISALYHIRKETARSWVLKKKVPYVLKKGVYYIAVKDVEDRKRETSFAAGHGRKRSVA